MLLLIAIAVATIVFNVITVPIVDAVEANELGSRRYMTMTLFMLSVNLVLMYCMAWAAVSV